MAKNNSKSFGPAILSKKLLGNLRRILSALKRLMNFSEGIKTSFEGKT